MTTKTAKELGTAQRADLQTLRKDAELMESLLKHPGWPRFMTMIEAVGQNFQRAAMQPIENALESVKTEHAKGALTGLTVAAQLPSAKIREAEDLLSLSADDEGN